MLTSIEIDGKIYHARREWDDGSEQYKDNATRPNAAAPLRHEKTIVTMTTE